MRKSRKLFPVFWAGMLIAAVISLLHAAPGDISRASVAYDGSQANNYSQWPDISDDGRYVVFYSTASNLVSGGSSGRPQIFMRDVASDTTTLVSVSSAGIEGDNASFYAAVSTDGRFAAFDSSSTNLVISDTNGVYDVFLRDMQSGVTSRVSVSSSGEEGNGNSRVLDISADGRYVVFESTADNLVPDDTNGYKDIFLHDALTGNTYRVSLDTAGGDANSASYNPSVSGDGRYVAFDSLASDLITGDAYSGYDVFVRDMQAGATTLISQAGDGTQGNGRSRNPSISGNGRYVAFESDATNLVSGDGNGFTDIFVRDMQAGTTTRISAAADGTEGNGDSTDPRISGNGRYVTFSSEADNLVAGDGNGVADVFIYDLQTGAIARASELTDGTEADGESLYPVLSGDGRYLVFQSDAANLISADSNNKTDIFLRENDIDPPGIASITRADANPTNATDVDFLVTFTENVTDVDTADFDLAVSGVSGAAVSGVSGGGSAYTVTVSTGAGEGTLRLDVADTAVISDTMGNGLIGIPYSGGETYTIDKTAPTVTAVARADANPASADNVDFSVTFSEDVEGVDTADFSLTTSGDLTGTAVTGVSGGGSVYTVTVSTGTGSGTLRLDLPDTAVVADSAGNSVSGLPYTGGESYTINVELYLPLILSP